MGQISILILPSKSYWFYSGHPWTYITEISLTSALIYVKNVINFSWELITKDAKILCDSCTCKPIWNVLYHTEFLSEIADLSPGYSRAGTPFIVLSFYTVCP